MTSTWIELVSPAFTLKYPPGQDRQWMFDGEFTQNGAPDEVLVCMTVKLSSSVPEFCRMKLRTEEAPGSRFRSFAAIRVAVIVVKVMVLDSIVTELEDVPVTSKLPPKVYVPSRLVPSNDKETFSGSGGFAKLPEIAVTVFDVTACWIPDIEEVRVSCAVTLTFWFPVLSTVMSPAQRARATFWPSSGRESAIGVASSTATTLTPVSDISSFDGSESVDEPLTSHTALMLMPDPTEASQ